MSARARHAPWFRSGAGRYGAEVAEHEREWLSRTGVYVWPVSSRTLAPLSLRIREAYENDLAEMRRQQWNGLFGLDRKKATET